MSWKESYKFRNEADTIRNVIGIYCQENHGVEKGLCSDCSELLEYSLRRLSLCPFAEKKIKCSACPVHCYTPEMCERIREVMKYAGPRMLLRHPLQAVRHIAGR